MKGLTASYSQIATRTPLGRELRKPRHFHRKGSKHSPHCCTRRRWRGCRTRSGCRRRCQPKSNQAPGHTREPTDACCKPGGCRRKVWPRQRSRWSPHIGGRSAYCTPAVCQRNFGPGCPRRPRHPRHPRRARLRWRPARRPCSSCHPRSRRRSPRRLRSCWCHRRPRVDPPSRSHRPRRSCHRSLPSRQCRQ